MGLANPVTYETELWTPSQKPPYSPHLRLKEEWARDIRAAWLFNESGGNTVFDYSKNLNHGTLINNAKWTKLGGRVAIDFDDTDEYILVGDNDSLSFGNGATDSAFTIAAWVNRVSTSNNDAIVNKYATSNLEYVLGAIGTTLYAWVYDNSSSGYRGRTIANVHNYAPAGSWHFYVWTYDGGGLNSSNKLYIDGIQRDSGDFFAGSYTSMENLSADVELAGHNPGTGGPLEGQMDVVSIWGRDLTNNEIVQLFNEQYIMWEFARLSAVGESPVVAEYVPQIMMLV